MRSPRSFPPLRPLFLLLVVLALAIPAAAVGAPWEANSSLSSSAPRADMLPAVTDPAAVVGPGDAAMEAVGTEALATASATGVWTNILITPRKCHGAVYDPVRRRMIVFGGADDAGNLNDVWALSLDGTWRWTQLTTAGESPCGRQSAGVIYDSGGDRLVVFGGYTGSSYLNDVWALSLGDVPTWTQLTPAGAPPVGRVGASAIYDPLRGRLVAFGGYDGTTYLNEVWALSLGDGPAWTQLAAGGTLPKGRRYHSAIYDPVRDRMLIFGGDSASTLLGDCCGLSLGSVPTWTTLSAGGRVPSARGRHSAMYDPVGDRMLVFGGCAPDYVADCYALSLGSTPAWTKLSPALIARGLHSAIYDPVGKEMVIFGGYQTAAPWRLLRNDVARLVLGGTPAWVKASVVSPGVRYGSAAIYDPVRDRMVVFGGHSGSAYLGDCYALAMASPPTWTRLYPAGTAPAARRCPGAIYDPVRDRMIVFGGTTGSGYVNDIWALSLAGPLTWTQLAPVGDLPTAGPPDGCVYDPVRDRMLITGGSVGSLVYALSLSGTPTWTRLEPTGTPPTPASGTHTVAIYDPVRDRLLTMTATRENYESPYIAAVAALSLGEAPVWTTVVAGGKVDPPQVGSTAIYDPVRDRMVLFGGVFGDYSAGTGGAMIALSLGDPPAWMISCSPYSVDRCWQNAIYDPLRDRMVIFGGYDIFNGGYSNYLDDTWLLTWGEPATASVTCPEAAMWMAGSSVTLDYGITNPYGFAQIADYTLTSARDWPGFPITGSVVVGVGTTTVPIAVPAPDTAAGNTNELTFTVRTRSVPEQASGTHELRNAVVPVQLALVSAEAEPGRARLTWYTATGAGLTATVYRRSGTSEWAALGTVAADGSGQIVYEDRTVTPGTRYGYRLGVSENGVESYLGEAWVEVPVAVAFALAGAEPNPAVRELQVAFSLPDAAGARLEAYDVTGRRVAQAEVGGLGAGRHVVKLGGELRSGVYLVRLTRGEQTLTQRAVVVR
jgi:hypothetical protein